jgi:hypothetical protein
MHRGIYLRLYDPRWLATLLVISFAAVPVTALEIRGAPSTINYTWIGQNFTDEIREAIELSLNQSINSSISPAGDGDFYKIYVASPRILQAQLSNVPMGMRGRIDLYAENMKWITRKDAEKPGDNVLLTADITKSGLYSFSFLTGDCITNRPSRR